MRPQGVRVLIVEGELTQIDAHETVAGDGLTTHAEETDRSVIDLVVE